MAIDKITKIDDNFVLTGTHVEVPVGTTAERPSGPENGYFRYNTTLGSLEFYNGSDNNWVSTNLIPTISSLTGNINDTYEATLKFETSNTTDDVTVVFRNSSNVELAEVTDVDSTTQPFYVDIPSAVTSAVSSGDTVKVSIQNQDGTPSDSVTKTVIAAPTGGTINTYTEGGSAYRSHTFTSSGSFTQSENLLVNALLVGGGGGGAAGGGTGSESGGGGGAGGMYTYTTTFYSSDSPRNVTVGAGGAGREGGTTGNAGGNGADSNIQTDLQVVATGGGGGGQQETDGSDGGSGGGAGGIDSADPNQDGGAGTSGQGSNGGDATEGSGDMGAGGGGKSAAGYTTNSASGGGGQGGAGAANTYKDGTTDYYAGGGGGGQNNTGTANSDGSGNVGGTGGGGAGNTGTSGSGSNGTANTGGGGGGGTGGSGVVGGNGGSGIVIIRYKTDQVSA